MILKSLPTSNADFEWILMLYTSNDSNFCQVKICREKLFSSIGLSRQFENALEKYSEVYPI